MRPCTWLEAGSEVEDEPINWVIAWMCNRCDDESVLEICDAHYKNTFIDVQGNTQKFNCPACQGDVSWVARRMDNLIEDARINNG
jgi:hypothetical protein